MVEPTRKQPVDQHGPVPLEGRRTRLRPLTTSFFDQIYELVLTDQIPWVWAGGSQTPDAFREAMFGDLLIQFQIENKVTGEPIGLVWAYRANFFHKFAYIGFVLLPEYRMRVWPLEAAMYFANFLFVRYDFEILYAESAERHFEQFESGAGSIFEVEGRLKRRLLVNGHREDLLILAIPRDRWVDVGALPGPGPGPGLQAVEP